MVEVLGPHGALLHTGAALDALAHHLAHIVGIDGPHGAQPGAQAAPNALVQVGDGLGLQEVLDGLAVPVSGGVVGADGVAALHLDWLLGQGRQPLDFLGGLPGQLVH